jgi:hypothetical protein
MNWIKCTDVNKQPIYVNIENATSFFGSNKRRHPSSDSPVARTT